MEAMLHTIWQQLHNDLKRFIFKRVHDEDITNDIIQEVFLKAHQKISSLKEKEKLASWIYTITRNTITDHFRIKKNSTFQDETSTDETSSSESYKTSELASCAQHFIEALPEKYREAIRLTEIENVSQKELAARLNISYSGAKTRVQRGREKLKELFEACCAIQHDVYGNIIDYQSRENSQNKKC